MAIELIIPLLAFFSVMTIGSAIMVARNSKRASLAARLGQMQASLDDEEDAKTKQLVGIIQKIGSFTSPKGPSASLRQQLGRAGYFSKSAAAVYLGAKILLLVIGVAGVGALVVSIEAEFYVKLFLTFTGGAVLSFIPNIIVSARRSKRRGEIWRHLPDAVDLLEISVSAGMGLDQAWNSVADRIRKVSPILGDEMALTNLEIHLGSPRGTAMRNMAERTGVDELSSLVAVLIQSERFGTSISEAMRSFASGMRETRSQKAEEMAEKTAVKLLFPMVVFVFPAILIVAAGPAALKIAAILGTE